MNPNLTQRRRGVEKEGGMVVSTVKDTQPRLQRNHTIAWIGRVGTPLPTQASGANAPSASAKK